MKVWIFRRYATNNRTKILENGISVKVLKDSWTKVRPDRTEQKERNVIFKFRPTRQNFEKLCCVTEL